jgi:hypothetical protein
MDPVHDDVSGLSVWCVSVASLSALPMKTMASALKM